MTFAIFMIAVLGLLIAILNFLPVAMPLSPGIATGIVLIVGYMKAWNFLFPINELMICVGIVTVYYVWLWSWTVLVRIYHAIRGTNQGN